LLVVVAALLLAATPTSVLADGGVVQVADQAVGPYRLTVTTSPNPIRVGVADVSAIVLQGVDQLVPDATVSVSAAPATRPSEVTTYPATHAIATNKQYYAANVRLTDAGRWLFSVQVRGPHGGGEVHFAADVSPAVLGLTPFELACTIIPVGLVALILGGELRRFWRRRHPGSKTARP
jgi:hypothetical protein